MVKLRAILPRLFFLKLEYDMNTKMNKIAMAIGALVMAGGAMAQSTATTSTATANATIVAPITIANGATLEFGNVVAGSGTVVISSAGGRTDSSTALTPGTQRGTFRNATFNVTGEGAYTYVITLPTTPVTLSDTATTPNTMTVDTFTVAAGTSGSVVGTTSGAIGTLVSGAGQLKVGATLNVGALQVPGAYTGTYSVTVAYN